MTRMRTRMRAWQVFQSAAHMADTYYWYTYLERPVNDTITDYIMDQYDLLYRYLMSSSHMHVCRGAQPHGQTRAWGRNSCMHARTLGRARPACTHMHAPAIHSLA